MGQNRLPAGLRQDLLENLQLSTNVLVVFRGGIGFMGWGREEN